MVLKDHKDPKDRLDLKDSQVPKVPGGNQDNQASRLEVTVVSRVNLALLVHREQLVSQDHRDPEVLGDLKVPLELPGRLAPEESQVPRAQREQQAKPDL